MLGTKKDSLSQPSAQEHCHNVDTASGSSENADGVGQVECEEGHPTDEKHG